MDLTRTRLAVPRDLLDPARAVRDVELPGLAPWKRGKVRSIYEARSEHLVRVASDRLWAYDSVLFTPIPGKGAILSLLSGWWMRTLASVPPHPLVSDEPAPFPAPFAALLRGRAHRVRQAGCSPSTSSSCATGSTSPAGTTSRPRPPCPGRS